MALMGRAVLLLWSVAGVLGWSQEGHDAIGMTAMSALHGNALKQTKKLLGGKDISDGDVQGWAHKVDNEYPWAKPLHFQDNSEDSTAEQWIAAAEGCTKFDFTTCPNNMCLVSGIDHFYGHVNGTVNTKIEFPNAVEFTDEDSVKFLLNLIGDMHQPFHLVPPSVRQNLTVMYEGKKHSIFDLWDTVIVNVIRDSSRPAWDGGWTHISNPKYHKVKQQYEVEKEEWLNLKDPADAKGIIERWAQENAKVSCELLQGTSEFSEGQKKLEDGYVLSTRQLFTTWKRLMELQILTAGARTAVVLHGLMHTTMSRPLSRGSGVKVEADPEEELNPLDFTDSDSDHIVRPQKIQQDWFANLCTNFVILIFVLAGFFFMVYRNERRYQRPGITQKKV